MSEKLVPLRNTISRKCIEVPESQVARYLAIWPNLEVARTAKPEVLAPIPDPAGDKEKPAKKEDK